MMRDPAIKNDAPRRGPRFSKEVDRMMIERLIEAIYPVLIPMEQQDMAIQAANLMKVQGAACVAWNAFKGPSPIPHQQNTTQEKT